MKKDPHLGRTGITSDDVVVICTDQFASLQDIRVIHGHRCGMHNRGIPEECPVVLQVRVPAYRKLLEAMVQFPLLRAWVAPCYAVLSRM